MDDYNLIIGRISEGLVEIEAELDEPLSVAANNYRRITEAICKAILVGHGKRPEGDLEKMISDSFKTLQSDAGENSRDASMFRLEMKYLQSIGNTYSHDGPDSELTKSEDQSRAVNALTKAIRVAFFGSADLDPPAIPIRISSRFPARLLHKGTYEDLRAEEVVKLWLPNQQVKSEIIRRDSQSRVVYDYIESNVDSKIKLGALFLRSRSSLDKSITDFFESRNGSLPNSLHVVTPRTYRPDGHEIDRRKSIQDVVNARPPAERAITTVTYFDEFVWEKCLPENIRSPHIPSTSSQTVIPQQIEEVAAGGRKPKAHNARNYVKQVLTRSNEYSPVQVVTGPAGIGKTTFCDDIAKFIATQDKKHVVVLSSTDFRDISESAPVESVGDLYRLATEYDFIEENGFVDKHNFEINLGCGNFVLIIDGFDELESHLGDSLDFSKFMKSLADLEDCFHKVLVVLTVRDNDVDRFKLIPHTTTVRLLGFSNEDTERYLKERLKPDQVSSAKSLLDTFKVANEDQLPTTVPLYASLICDYLIEEGQINPTPSSAGLSGAMSFSHNRPLDRLIKKVVDREIAKQSLGSISPDDFFDILIEVIRSPQSTITMSALSGFVSSCGGEESGIKPENFMRNPFLRWHSGKVSFKYDSLSYFFKSRLLARQVGEGTFTPLPALEFLSELSRGEGPLNDDFLQIFPPSANADSAATKKWFRLLIKHCGSSGFNLLSRRAISGFLYWAVNAAQDKNERTEIICELFESSTWTGFSILGKFHPLDLTDISIQDGYIENYANLKLCENRTGSTVFHNTWVDFDERSTPDKLDKTLFAETCRFSENLRSSFLAREMANESSIEIVRENLYKILKVGFRGNKFLWKSNAVYKMVTVIGKHSLQTYLDLLKEKGVLVQQPSRTQTELGFQVSEAWHGDARKLIEEKNLSHRLAEVASSVTSH